MFEHDFPHPSQDLMSKIKKRLEENQQKKKQKRRQLLLVGAVLLLFAVPASAYTIAKEFWGFSFGVQLAIDHNEGIAINKKLIFGDIEVTIENAVWEDNELALTYSKNRKEFKPENIRLVDKDGNTINRGMGSESNEYDGTIKFDGISKKAIEDGQIKLKIFSLFKYQPTPSFIVSTQLEITPEMKNGEWVDINQELKTAVGTYLLNSICFDKETTKINYEFTPLEEYKDLFSLYSGIDLLPEINLSALGKNYLSLGSSRSASRGVSKGHFNFPLLPVKKLATLQIGVPDNHIFVNWEVDIPVQNKKTTALALREEILLPEGKLQLTEIRSGTKSTVIDFNFVPAKGYEGIGRIKFQSFLRSNDKYYGYHGFNYEDHTPGLKGSITFDPIRYDDIDELEFILGSVSYTYNVESKVTATAVNLPQTVEALGDTFIIDKMETKKGKTFLHISYPKESRNFYYAEFKVFVGYVSRLSVSQRTKMGQIRLIGEEQLQQGLEQLKANLGDFGLEALKDVDPNQGPVGNEIEISRESEEVELTLTELVTRSFSGQAIKIPLQE